MNAINGYGMDIPLLYLALVRIILFIIQTRQFLGPLSFLASFAVVQISRVKWSIHFLLRHKLKKSEELHLWSHTSLSRSTYGHSRKKISTYCSWIVPVHPTPAFRGFALRGVAPKNKNKTLRPFREYKYHNYSKSQTGLQATPHDVQGFFKWDFVVVLNMLKYNTKCI